MHFRIEALLCAGVSIRLHVVATDDRSAAMPEHWGAAGLELFWHRRRGFWSGLSPKPYIVNSRRVGSMLPYLVNGPAVILFEGTHSCGFLGHPRLAGKTQWVRVHNREAEYYSELAQRPAPWLKRLYYQEEARRLASYEPQVLAQADLLLPASPRDEPWCASLVPGRVFGHRSYTSLQKVSSMPGRGDYALFHAALHIEDNVHAALSLAERMSKHLDKRLIIAGRQPPTAFIEQLRAYTNVELIANPSAMAMHALIAEAQVILLHSGHAAGYKIKLVESLALGRHILANSNMVAGSGRLADLVSVVDDLASWHNKLNELWQVDFDSTALVERRILLDPVLSPALGKSFCEKLASLTFTRN